MSEAVVLINTEIGAEEEVLDQLLQIKGVREAYIVYGVYDIIAFVSAGSPDELREIIVKYVRRIPRIKSTTTMTIVEGVKK